MFTSALIPLDGSPESGSAIAPACALLAEGGNAVLVGVLPRTELLVPALLDMLPHADPRLALRAAVSGHLERAGQSLGARRIRWSTEVREGDPASEILEAAREHRAGFIALATRGRGGPGHPRFGSVADRIARTSQIPVLLAPPGAGPDTESPAFTRIVVPLDGSTRAEAAIPVAARIAAALDAPVLLAQAVDARMLAAPLAGSSLPAVTPGMIATLREDAAFYLREACDRFGRVNRRFSWKVLDGAACDAIPALLRPGDLLVMTSHGRGGMARWPLGSVSEKLLRESPAPILLIRSGGEGPAPRGR